MANAIRQRTNFISGLTSDNPLSSGATTLNSSALANLPAVDSSHHALIILDPDGVNGAPEIVSVTAHTSSATSATIARAQEGTSARSHPVSTTWRHGSLVSDYGLTVEEVDGTPSVLVRKLILPNGSLTDNSDDSVTFGPTFSTYTPTWTADGSNPSLGNGTIAGAYLKLGKLVCISIEVVAGSTTTFGTGNWRFSLPGGMTANRRCGLAAWLFDTSAGAEQTGTAQCGSGDTVMDVASATGAVKDTVPWTWATGDHLGFSGLVEIQ